MLNNEQIQKYLSKLHVAGATSAVIAGGAVRDSLFGKPVKDIDIFVSKEQAHFITEVFSVEKNLYCGYINIPDVDGVFDIPVTHTELPVQIITMDEGMSPADRLHTFDFGFCQVAYDGKNIITTENFLNDYKNNTITLVYCENQHEYDRSMRRFERLKEKYPDHILRAVDKNLYPIH